MEEEEGEEEKVDVGFQVEKEEEMEDNIRWRRASWRREKSRMNR